MKQYDTTLMLNKENKELLGKLINQNRHVKYFHISDQLSSIKQHLNGYDKSLYNGITLLILFNDDGARCYYTKCSKKDTYYKAKGFNFVLKNAFKGVETVKDTFQIQRDYLSSTATNLPSLFLHFIKLKEQGHTLLTSEQIKKEIKFLENVLKQEDYSIVYKYDTKPYKGFKRTIKTTIKLYKDDCLVHTTSISLNPNDVDNRQIARLNVLQKIVNKVL